MVVTRTLVPLLLAALAALAAAHPDYSDTWEEFKQSYGKQYDSAEEEVTLFIELSTIDCENFYQISLTALCLASGGLGR